MLGIWSRATNFYNDVPVFAFFFFSMISGLVSLISINDATQCDADRRRAASVKLSRAIADIDEINRI